MRRLRCPPGNSTDDNGNKGRVWVWVGIDESGFAGSSTRAQLFGKSARSRFESPIGHENDLVTRARFGQQGIEQTIHTGHRCGSPVHGIDDAPCVPRQFRALKEKHPVRIGKGWCELVGMRAQAHGIAARLHRHHYPRRADFRPQALQCGLDGGRMVGEVVVEGDAVRLADDFQAPLDAAELRQRGDDRGDIDTDRMRRRCLLYTSRCV